MASSVTSSCHDKTNANISPAQPEGDNNDQHLPDVQAFEADMDILSGAKLSESQTFKSRKGKQMVVTPVIVDFRRLLLSAGSLQVLPGVRHHDGPNHDGRCLNAVVSNQELVHAVVGLYNVCLSEMTPDVLYSTVCEKWARTIILIRDLKECLSDAQHRKQNSEQPASEESPANGDCRKRKTKMTPPKHGEEADHSKSQPEQSSDKGQDSEDIYQPEEVKPGVFADVFSDTDEEESESEEEGEEDFSTGINAFLAAVGDRRQTRMSRISEKEELGPQHVGIENRLIAAATYDKTYCKPFDKVIHLTVIAVRRRFRKFGIGKYLLSQIKDTNVTGPYDAIVVHADNSALEFFERYGFSDDVILNSRFSELAEQFTNCTLMCYLPPFTGQSMMSDSIPELDIISMEKEITKWREKTLEAYQAELGCINRLRHEIIHLRALVSSQQNLIGSLASSNDKLRREKIAIEKEFLDYRLMTTKATFTGTTLEDEEDEISTEVLLRQLEQANRMVDASTQQDEAKDTAHFHVGSQNASAKEPYFHGKDTKDFFEVTQEFSEAMKKDSRCKSTYEVKLVHKALVPDRVEEEFHTCLNSLQDPGMVTRLYFCGTLDCPDRVSAIMEGGFTEQDRIQGQFGRGLYFSKYPSKAVQFSSAGKLLVAEVGLGFTQTVVKNDTARSSASEYFDSIITPGRLKPLGEGDVDSMLCQEYVVFSVHQAKPLYLIEYTTALNIAM